MPLDLASIKVNIKLSQVLIKLTGLEHDDCLVEYQLMCVKR